VQQGRLVDHELRVKLIAEESKEIIDAIEANDLIAAIDGACDLIYVVLGTMIAAGIDLEAFYAEVHRSNMAKVGGPVREDGKILKPAGWTPPDLVSVLAKQIERIRNVHR
jgi:predicted HAD superfamily Cof-like phosphohydrolase